MFSSNLQVRSLEQQNKLLEAEIKAYQDRFEKPTGLRLLYEKELRELNKVAEQMKVQRVRHNPASRNNSGAQGLLCLKSFQRANFYTSLRCRRSIHTLTQDVSLVFFKVPHLVRSQQGSGCWATSSRYRVQQSKCPDHALRF